MAASRERVTKMHTKLKGNISRSVHERERCRAWLDAICRICRRSASRCERTRPSMRRVASSRVSVLARGCADDARPDADMASELAEPPASAYRPPPPPPPPLPRPRLRSA
jgi:hypothetical protein